VSTELTGHLLVSNASLFDPNFRRTVVLIGHHDDEGAVGVVLNRPLDVTVDEAVPPLAELVAADEALFEGGPVQPDGAVVLAEFSDPTLAGVVAFGSVGFLPDEVDDADRSAIVRARIFAGYSGSGCGRRWWRASARPTRSCGRCRPIRRSTERFARCEQHVERRPAARSVLDPGTTAVQLGEPSDERQAEPHAG